MRREKAAHGGVHSGSEAATTAPNGTTNSGSVGAIVAAQAAAKPADYNLAQGVMRYLFLDRRNRSTIKSGFEKRLSEMEGRLVSIDVPRQDPV